MMEKMIIIPYTWTKDHWSIPHDVMTAIWDKMVKEGSVKSVFCSGSVTTGKEFHNFIKNPHNCVMTQWIGEDIVYLGWLNNFTARSAYAHFTCFKKIWGKRTVEAMKNAFKYWFSLKRDDGKPILDTLIGMIADDNQLAINMVKKCGVKFIGTIPNHSMNIYTGKKIGCTVSYIERSEVEKWEM